MWATENLQKSRNEKKVLLLEHLINMWDDNNQAFHVSPYILNVEIEDVYFLIGPSRQGAWIVLACDWETDLSTDEHMDEYCRVGTQKRNGKIPIKDIASSP